LSTASAARLASSGASTILRLGIAPVDSDQASVSAPICGPRDQRHGECRLRIEARDQVEVALVPRRRLQAPLVELLEQHGLPERSVRAAGCGESIVGG
jgi:hypothetical protein